MASKYEHVAQCIYFLLIWQDATMPLRQIICGGDYSWSVKNYGDYFCPFQERFFERNLLRKKKNQNKKKSPLRLFPGSKSRDVVLDTGWVSNDNAKIFTKCKKSAQIPQYKCHQTLAIYYAEWQFLIMSLRWVCIPVPLTYALSSVAEDERGIR